MPNREGIEEICINTPAHRAGGVFEADVIFFPEEFFFVIADLPHC